MSETRAIEPREFEGRCKLAVGDRIRLELRYGTEDFTVEEFRQCLGIFLDDKHREAGNFTPLCDLWGHGTGSESGYIGNYGEFVKNPVPLWMNLPRIESPVPSPLATAGAGL